MDSSHDSLTNLQRVSLVGCGLDPQSSLLKNLMFLHLSSPYVTSMPLQWGTADLLRTLGCFPSLESLSLIQTSPPSERELCMEIQVPLPMVTLSRLVSLHYIDYMQSISHVLRNIHMLSIHEMMTWCIDDVDGDLGNILCITRMSRNRELIKCW